MDDSARSPMPLGYDPAVAEKWIRGTRQIPPFYSAPGSYNVHTFADDVAAELEQLKARVAELERRIKEAGL